MEDAKELADNKAGSVSVRVERGEGDGRDDGKKHFGAEPNDKRQIEKRAQKSFHAKRIQGRSGGHVGESF